VCDNRTARSDIIDWCRADNPSHHAGGYYDVVYGPVTEDWKNRTLYEEYDQVSFHNQQYRYPRRSSVEGRVMATGPLEFASYVNDVAYTIFFLL
jgi:hypothetical protein